MMCEMASRATLFVFLARESCLKQLAEELEDHIQAKAPTAARMIYCGKTERRREGMVWLLVQQEEAIPFTNRLRRMLEHDEDIFAFMEISASQLLERLGVIPAGGA